MIMSLVLFENEFLNIVSISFTALILNELIMVALEINTWYVGRKCMSIPLSVNQNQQALVHGYIRDCHILPLRAKSRVSPRIFW